MNKLHLKICCSFTLAILLAAPALAQSTKFLLPETGFTITLSFTQDKQFTKDFRTIVIRSSGTTTRFTAHDQMMLVPATREERREAFFSSADAAGVRIDPSHHFLVGQYTVDAKPHTLLFFLSDAAASDVAPLLIIGFSDQGVPIKLLERPYQLIYFEATDTGALMTGKESISQAICGYSDPHATSTTTYDPYSIFLFQPNAKPAYQLEASRDYNRKHYVWAGSQSSEAITVIYNLPGHPKIIAAATARANKLLAKVKCIP